MIIGQFDFPADEWTFVCTDNFQTATREHQKETRHSYSPWAKYNLCDCYTIFFEPSAVGDEKLKWPTPKICRFWPGSRVVLDPKFEFHDMPTPLFEDQWVATRKRLVDRPVVKGDLGKIKKLPLYDIWVGHIYGVEFDRYPGFVLPVHESHLALAAQILKQA